MTDFGEAARGLLASLPPGSGGSGTPSPVASSESLSSLIEATLVGETGLTCHIDVDLGGVDEATLEPLLYRLLGVTATSTFLVGVSWIDTADLAAGREAWGEPIQRVDLHRGARSPLAWDIWRMPAAMFIEETIAGASLVLPEVEPSWILFIEPSSDDAMLFACPRHCLHHR